MRGSIVGTRLDLQEVARIRRRGQGEGDRLDRKLEDINDVFARMHKGEIEGRVVLDLAS